MICHEKRNWLHHSQKSLFWGKNGSLYVVVTVWDMVTGVGEVKATSRALGNIFDRSRTPTAAWYGGIDGIDPEKIGKRPSKRCCRHQKHHPKPLPSVTNITYHTHTHTYNVWQMTLWSQSFCLLFLLVSFIWSFNWTEERWATSVQVDGGSGWVLRVFWVTLCDKHQKSSKYRVYNIVYLDTCDICDIFMMYPGDIFTIYMFHLLHIDLWYI